jgi:hypothetical protein
MLLVKGTRIVTIQNGVNMILMCAESRFQGRPVDLGIASVEPNVVCGTGFVCLTELFLKTYTHTLVVNLVLELVPKFLFNPFGTDGAARALVKILDGFFEIEIAYASNR